MVRSRLQQLQINLGKLCNQTCTHCHVDAGPTKKRENMGADVVDRILELSSHARADNQDEKSRVVAIDTVDLTGGAPEMNPHFRRLATTFRDWGVRVIDRCNLTILTEPGYDWVADFLADQEIDVVASLPCYLEDNVDGQRGRGVFQRSITGLRELNARGFAGPGSPRRLDLVFNPTGPSLPPDQRKLEADYREYLWNNFGIEFGNLLTITNIPIRRYASFLRKRGQLDSYVGMLADNHNEAAVDNLMCRTMVSVSWDGRLYDCDFNQMIDWVDDQPTLWTIDQWSEWCDRPVAVANHCYGCTAGSGSSCGGAIVS
ncbi:MAG: arsenosugar biosynthesis radical SAM (seleno)protein ArsS [Planctomycetota bacterium]